MLADPEEACELQAGVRAQMELRLPGGLVEDLDKEYDSFEELREQCESPAWGQMLERMKTQVWDGTSRRNVQTY